MKLTVQNDSSMRYVVQRPLPVTFLLENTAKVLNRYRCDVKCQAQSSEAAP